MHSTPQVQVAVIMRRERVPGAMSQWQTWRWVLHDVVGHDQVPHEAHLGTQPRCLRQSDDEQVWIHPGFTVSLHRDDVQGYYLNSTSPAPCWFVLWRMEEEPALSDEVMAVPVMVSLSYHDAGRWLDAQEQVDQVPAPTEVVAWVSAFAQEHWEVEPKRRRRPDSFQPLHDRFGNPALVSTGKFTGRNGEGQGVSDTRPDGFLRRWSSRKTEVRQGKTPPPEPAREALPAEQPGATAHRADGVRSTPPELPPPTLDDVGQLTTSSDYSAFVRHEVPADVKNAAMKKLFANPHFNVMDGLDVYIDDYSQPDPLPLSTLRQMASAKFMNLVDDTEDPQPDETPQPAAPHGSPESVAQFESHRPPSEALDHDHADLRLQPDPAARPQDTGPEPG